MTTATDSEAIRRSSLKYLWMHNRDWTQMAEQGEPLVIVEGSGVRVTDSAGKSWIDVNGGYNSVNAGYGRTEIIDAAYEQMLRLPYFPNQTTSPPTIKLARKLAEITREALAARSSPAEDRKPTRRPSRSPDPTTAAEERQAATR